MKKPFLLFTLLLCQHLTYSQENSYLYKDIDSDNIVDTIYLDPDKSTIVCKLSSKKFRKIESKPIEILNIRAGIKEAKNGFIFSNHSMRAGYSNQFRYDKKSKKIRLIGMSRYEFGNAANDGSGESSVNLLTRYYIGNWNYYNDENDKLEEVPSIKTKMYFDKVYLSTFSEGIYFDYAERCAALYHKNKKRMIGGKRGQ